MTDAERRRAGYRATALLLADVKPDRILAYVCEATGDATSEELRAVMSEVARIRDDLTRAGAVKDDLPAR